MTDAKSDEEQRLVEDKAAARKDERRNAFTMLFLICAFVSVSATLINFNKYMMQPTVFPFSVALTWLHMTTSSVFTWALYLITGDKFCPAMKDVQGQLGAIFVKFLPIAMLFAASIVLSNEAYLYASVPFLQMMKEFNVVLVFTVGVIMAAEKFNYNLVSVLAVVVLGCLLSVRGEMKYSRVGFLLQACCQCSEVVKIMMQQVVTQGMKLDPLTAVMILSPLSWVVLSAAMPFFYTPAILPALQLHWPLLLVNCGNALLLNIIVASILRYASGLTMVITGVFKDICIVTVAAMFFRAEISSQQIIGFAIAITGVLAYSVLRSAPEATEKYGASRTLGHVLFGRPLLPDKVHSLV